MSENQPLNCKWFQLLRIIGFTSLANSALSAIPAVPAAMTTWISRGIILVMIYTMLQMAQLHERYQKAGVFRIGMLACLILFRIVSSGTLLTLAASVLSILAVYQEYSAHSALAARFDADLSRKWHSLFNWGILASILVSFGYFIAVLVLTVSGMDMVRTAGIVVGILQIPQLVIDVLYLFYLKKMLTHFQEDT